MPWTEADLTTLKTSPPTPDVRLSAAETAATAGARTDIKTTLTELPVLTETTPGPTSEAKQTITHTTVTVTTETFKVIHMTERPTFTPASTNAAGELSEEGGIGSLSRTSSIIVIVCVTTAAGVLISTAAFFAFRWWYKRRMARMGLLPDSPDGSDLERGRRRTAHLSEKPLPNGSRNTTIDMTRRSSKTSQTYTHSTSHSQSPIVESPRDRLFLEAPKPMIDSPAPPSELEANPPANPVIGSAPNPAELPGDLLIEPSRSWIARRSWMQSRRSNNRTIRESFGEKVNDPAAALRRLKIPPPTLPPTRKTSPRSASPGARSFRWRLPRSPKTPTSAGGSAFNLPDPSRVAGVETGHRHEQTELGGSGMRQGAADTA
ncbi:hypothetical protein VTJ04DRAFT_5329 [Mycothermus thermophilus]|uniref:uncharacterized protein n=1 Tax=Humicola insolens TaxID=85995 RepID=UPI003742EC96